MVDVSATEQNNDTAFNFNGKSLAASGWSRSGSPPSRSDYDDAVVLDPELEKELDSGEYELAKKKNSGKSTTSSKRRFRYNTFMAHSEDGGGYEREVE